VQTPDLQRRAFTTKFLNNSINVDQTATHVCVNILDKALGFYYMHGSRDLRKRLFPEADPSYWKHGSTTNKSFEDFYSELDSEHRAAFIEMVRDN